ncbi:NACHT domain-containing protein [Saccharothrix saharensis]|uniref:NACHT domain-containing protein n=1 Tax=Saccharothrix saharensis TaxID=571190 RepID=A0A543J525_9PSEU|nr:NACHT domain-containing protein [Saccharothrix saharensis]TQM77916.1 NACHT domain-containing protein [Saccharothrix saharensis]
MNPGDFLRPAGPAVNFLVKAMRQLKGAETVSEPVRMDPRITLPGLPPLTRIEGKRVEEFAAKVIGQLAEFRATELRGLPDHDWNAAIEAAQATLNRSAPLDVTLALDADLDARRLVERLVDNDSERPRIAQLAGGARDAYGLILVACAAHLIEFASSRPHFAARVDVELIRRTGALLRERLTESSEFELRYREALRRKLRNLRLFGLHLGHVRADYPLTTAYISLSAAPEGRRAAIDDLALADPVARNSRVRLSHLTSARRRLLIRGEAGSGKTTLLQWLATAAATGSDEVPDLAGKVPFLIRLRDFADRALPASSDFTAQISPELADRDGWARSVLLEGRGLVLVDGIDELPEDRRDAVRDWLDDLTTQYAANHFVVTSRPAAASADWLEAPDFTTFRILPMDMTDIADFIAHWHNAMRDQARSDQDKAEISRFQSDLEKTLSTRRDLRKLATNPLMCALICALHLDRLRELPRDRVKLYQAALEMLLSERDRQRRVPTFIDAISRDTQETLLAHLAYWMIRNNRLNVTHAEIEERITHERRGMPHLSVDTPDLASYLVLRSGVLQFVTADRADFLHRTFQEYLAAQAVLDHGDLDFLVQNAHLDQWREVVPLVVKLANRRDSEQVVKGLVERGDRERKNRHTLHLLATLCLDTVSYLSPAVIADVKERTARLFPPTTAERARDLAKAGDLVLDLIPDPQSLKPRSAELLLRTVRDIGGDGSLLVLARFAKLQARSIRQDLGSQWPDCHPIDYVRHVLESMSLDDLTVYAYTMGQLDAITSRRLRVRSLDLRIDRDLDKGILSSLDQLDSLTLRAVSKKRLFAELETLEVHTLRVFGVHPVGTHTMENLEVLSFYGDIPISRLSRPPKLRSLALDNEARTAEMLVIPDLGMSTRQGRLWHRSNLAEFSPESSVERVTLLGWPSEDELRTLTGMAALKQLHVAIFDDRMRNAALSSKGGIYPYQPVAASFATTSRMLPKHVQVHVNLIREIGTERPAEATSETVRSILHEDNPARTVFVQGAEVLATDR